MKHCLVTRRVIVLRGQTITNMFEWKKCFAMFAQIFDVVHILSNTIKQGVRTENIWSCLIAKLPVQTGLKTNLRCLKTGFVTRWVHLKNIWKFKLMSILLAAFPYFDRILLWGFFGRIFLRTIPVCTSELWLNHWWIGPKKSPQQNPIEVRKSSE